MAHDHQQRQKSDKPDAEGGSVAVQATPEQSALGALEALPGLSFDTLNTLQGSIGNAAIGRMVRAGNVAAAEPPTPVSPDTQDDIDAERSGGEAMAGGVRLHSGPPADDMARSLNANAFTQGRDVFLGANAGQETLAHEMTHVSQGAPASGAVMREPATQTPAAPSPVPVPYPNAGAAPDAVGVSKPMGAAWQDPDTVPGATLGPEDGEVRYVDRLPTIGEPGIRYVVKSREMKQAEKRYNLQFIMYDKPITAENLTPAEVVSRLKAVRASYFGDIDMDRQEHLRLKANREDHWVVGFWADTFGGVELPDVDMWNEVGAGPLQTAMAALESTDAVLEEHWKAKEAQSQHNIDPSLMNNPYMQEAMEFDATEQRIHEAIVALEEARAWIVERENKVEEYRSGTIKGASRAITGIKVSIVVLSAAAGGEGAGFAGDGAGLIAKGVASAGTSGVIGASEEFFTQVGEMRIGERKDWDFDFGKIAKRGVKDTVLAFTGAVVGGKFSSVLSDKYIKWVYGLDEAMLAGQGLTKEMLINKGEKLAIEWIAGIGAQPFNTAANKAMDVALGDKTNIHSFGDFAGQVWDDLEQGAALDGILKLAGAGADLTSHASTEPTTSSGGGGEATSTSPTTEGGAVTSPMAAPGGGGSSPPTTSTPEGTGGGGGEGGGPSSDIGTATTEAMPTQDVGTADTLQMPAESGKGPGDTEPMSTQDIGNLDTQTMASEDIGTRDTAEQPAARDTEPHDVANAPTQEVPAQPDAKMSTPEDATASPEAATQASEGHPVPPANGEVQPINDRVEASRIAAQAAREGGRVRWVRGSQADVNAEWQGAGGTGDAPAGWVSPEGGLVINTNEIPAPVRSEDIVSGPLREPGAATPTGGAASSTQSVTPDTTGPQNGGGGSGGGGSGAGGPGATSLGMGAAGPAGENAPPRLRPTSPGMGAAGPAGEGALPQPRTTSQGMGAAGPAGENAAPRDTVPMAALEPGQTSPGMGAVGPAGENAAPRDTLATPAQEPRQFSETSELTEPINRESRMSVSGFPGSLPPGYGAFRTRVRIQSGAVVDAVVKIYPPDMAAQFNSEVAGAQAAANTLLGPEFYGVVPVEGSGGDLAFAMEPIEGAFAAHGSEKGAAGYDQAVAEAAEAASRINDRTIEDVYKFSSAILNQGYHYGGSYGGEVQGLIGPNGEWTPIDFQGLKPLPSPENAAEYDAAIKEHEGWVEAEVTHLKESRPDFQDDDPTQH